MGWGREGINYSAYLHSRDVLAAPHRLKHSVGKTQNHEVLHHFFAEVVI